MIVVPTLAKVEPAASLVSVIDGVCVAVTVSGASSVTSVPPGVVPVAVPMLVIDPASTSAWVVTWVAVHVTLAPGASVDAGQVIVDKPGAGSVTSTAVNVTLPVLVTSYE